MTDAELDEIAARAAAASPGPWSAVTIFDGDDSWCDGVRDANNLDVVRTDSGVYPPGPTDATFIAHARTDVPALVAEVRRLQAALRRVEEITNLHAVSNYEPLAKALTEHLDKVL